MKNETLGAHLRNLLTPYKNLLQLVKDGKADEETIRKYDLDNLDDLIAFCDSEEMQQKHLEPVSEDLEQAAEEYANEIYEHNKAKTNKDWDTFSDGYRSAINEHVDDAFIAGAQWQKEREFTHIEPTDNGYQAAIHYMEDCQEVDDFARRGITWIAERYFIQGAKWREKQYLVSKDMEIAFKEYAKREHCECDLETSGEPIQYDSTNDLIDACRYGALLQKEQMMKDTIEGWVARDECGDIAIFSDKPHRDLGLGMWTPARNAFLFPRKDEYPDVTWDSEPQKVKVIIIKE